MEVHAVKALPFTIEGLGVSNVYKNALKVATIYADVKGGSTDEWAATGVVIAQETAALGANSIDVTVMRSDVKSSEPRKFREIAHIYFSPDLKKTIWSDEPQWVIHSAKAADIANLHEIHAYDDFFDNYNGFVKAGIADDIANQKATALVIRKYRLPKDWMLPLPNLEMTGSGIPRESLNIDSSQAVASIAAIKACMNGNAIRAFGSC